MIGFHVTFLRNLDSILEVGLLAMKTTDNNFPLAYDNQHERLFFMPDIESAKWWKRNYHQMSKGHDGNDLIIEFEIPDDIPSYPDPYSYDSTSPLLGAKYVEISIPPSRILDIHES